MLWDDFDLERFVSAQDTCFENVLSELKAGRKSTHWMWFVFPQLEGLGKTIISERFAIQSAEEAEAYMLHPILSQRLIMCAELLCAHSDKTAEDILGFVDAQKLCSSMTLFANVEHSDPIFQMVLNLFFTDEECAYTKDFLF